MRDVIWTLIVVWLVYRLVEMFKLAGRKTAPNNINTGRAQPQSQPQAHPHSDAELKNAIKKHLNKEGEYVDFEELK